jgi:hypothetical protein
LGDVRKYAARLKHASAREILHRVREQGFLWLLKRVPWVFKKALVPPAVGRTHIASLQRPSEAGAIDCGVLEGIARGARFCLGEDAHRIERFEDRFRGRFCFDIRPGFNHPDIRAVWEPARLQHLTILFHALPRVGEPCDGKRPEPHVLGPLLGWIRKNPFPFGPHYMCSMECALRVPVLLLGLKRAEGIGTQESQALISAIYEHGWLIRHRLSLYSSLGNHTVSEAYGLAMAGALFTESPVGREWLKVALALLEQECRHQILDDGGPVEQSLSYHRFILDLYWLAVDFLEKNRLHDCTRMRERLELGEHFLQSFGEPLPSIGDSDDGHAVAPGLFPQSRPPDANGIRQTNGLTARTFGDCGYTVIHCPDDVRITFDHGPLGLHPLYNHGHADALSLTVYKSGSPFLIDPGTYSYNADPQFRAYFKGTSAHNTVSVDGQDQARQVTGNIWGRAYKILDFERKDVSDGIVLSATHDGYAPLPGTVYHTRKVRVHKNGACVLQDSFRGSGNHLFETCYHLHPHVQVVGHGRDGWMALECSGTRISLNVAGANLRMARGEREPLLGWYSPSYGLLEETAVLHGKAAGAPSEIQFITMIGFDGPESMKLAEQLAEEL